MTLLQQRGMQPPGGRRGQKASSSSVEGGGVDDSAGYCDHGPKYGKDDADNGEDTAEAHGREEVKSGISSGDTMDTQGPLSPERLQSGGEDEHPLQAASSTPTGMQPPSSAFLEWRPVLRHVLQQAIGGVLSMAVDHTIKIVKQTTRAYINQPAAMSPLPSLPQHILGPEQSTQLVAAEMFLTTVALSVRPLHLVDC